MAIIKSSKKRIKIGERNRAHNLWHQRRVKAARRKVLEAKTKKAREKVLPEAYRMIDRAVKKKVIKAKKGARLKSQLAQEKS